MTTVLCHGVFDVLHLGHIRHLQEAKSLGDHLVVSITSDKHVAKLKGNGRPHFSAEQRREALMALDSVDEVVISDDGTAIETIKRLAPSFYVKGPDYAGANHDEIIAEIKAVESVGGKFHTTTAEKWSSTQLLRDVRLPEETFKYVDAARKRGFLDHILPAFDAADKINIAFVGETIVDEYRYVKPLARPSKEFVIATVADGEETFAGGIIAAAKQAEWKHVDITTGKTAITKTRWVDRDFARKLFEVYSTRESDRCYNRDGLAKKVKWADICVVMDFGHGFLGDEEIDILQGAKYLAVTAQTNAGTASSNPVTKYNSCNYVCVDEGEASLATRSPYVTLFSAARILAHDTKAEYVTITRGRYGSFSWSRERGPMEVPAFITSGYDTMGAGDAFLAVAAPLLAVGLDMEMAAFAGNVAGGLKTAILGHRSHVGRDDIIKNLEWLLK